MKSSWVVALVASAHTILESVDAGLTRPALQLNAATSLDRLDASTSLQQRSPAFIKLFGNVIDTTGEQIAKSKDVYSSSDQDPATQVAATLDVASDAVTASKSNSDQTELPVVTSATVQAVLESYVKSFADKASSSTHQLSIDPAAAASSEHIGTDRILKKKRQVKEQIHEDVLRAQAEEEARNADRVQPTTHQGDDAWAEIAAIAEQKQREHVLKEAQDRAWQEHVRQQRAEKAIKTAEARARLKQRRSEARESQARESQRSKASAQAKVRYWRRKYMQLHPSAEDEVEATREALARATKDVDLPPPGL